MVTGACAADTPDLLKPLAVERGWNHGEQARLNAGAAVAARLALEEDVLDVVLDDPVRLIGLSEESPAVLDFERRVSDLVPDDRRKVVEPDAAGVFLDGGVKREDDVTPESAARDEDIAGDDDEASARDENAHTVRPHPIEL